MAIVRFAALLLASVIAASPAESADEPFPEAKAVVKRWDVVWSLEPWAQKAVVKVKKDILVRDPLGTDASNQVIVYYATKTELTKFDAKTIHADGQEIIVPSSFRLERPIRRSGTRTFKALQFTFPDVQPGSVLHYEYELHLSALWFDLPIDAGWWELQGDLPVLQAKLTARVKDDQKAWEPHTQGIVPLDRWCQAGPIKDFDFVSYEINCHDVPAFESELLAPPDSELRARVFVYAWPKASGKPTMNDVAILLADSISTSLAQSKKMPEVAAQWKGTTLTPTQQLEEVVKWVRDNIALTNGGSETLDAAFEQKAGTTWERNLLALGLMRELGLIARPALLADRSSMGFHADVPDASQLEHLFIAVGKPELAKYIDVNCDYCVPGVPPWQYLGPGAGGVILDVMNNPLMDLLQLLGGKIQSRPASHAKTPTLPAKYNSEIRKRTIALDPSGAARVKGSITWQVQHDVDKRELWSSLTAAGRRHDCIGYLPVDVEDASVVTGDPENVKDYLNCSFEFSVPDAAFRLGTRLLVPAVDDFTEAIQLPIQAERRFPVHWRYARAVQSDVVYTLPAGAIVTVLPQPTSLKGPDGMTFQAQWLRTDNENEVKIRGLLLVDTATLAPADFEATREFLSKIRSYLNDGIELEIGP